MDRLTFLRHTTPAVPPGTCYGRSNLGLADSFEAEARTVIAALPPFDHLVTSPLTRCRALAEEIAAATGHVASVAPDWREMHFGAWEGRRWDDLPRADLDAWAADFLHYRGHGGESVAGLRDRIAAALHALPGDRCLIVTHLGCIKAARHLLGEPGAWEFTQPFGSLSTLSSSVS